MLDFLGDLLEIVLDAFIDRWQRKRWAEGKDRREPEERVPKEFGNTPGAKGPGREK